MVKYIGFYVYHRSYYLCPPPVTECFEPATEKNIVVPAYMRQAAIPALQWRQPALSTPRTINPFRTAVPFWGQIT